MTKFALFFYKITFFLLSFE